MSITEAPGGATERTWRPPLETRIAVAFCMGVILILPAGFLAITLWTNQVPDALWVTLACALAAWSFLAWRTLAQSVTLTPDRLVVRNVFTTNQVPLAEVTEVGFHRSKLTVTSRHGPFAIRSSTVGTAVLGYSYWSGRRSRADSIADAINHAAGLPPLPPRKEIISPTRTRALLVAAVVLSGVGAYLGPIGSMRLHHHSFALTEVGSTAWVFGIGALGFAFRLTLDHRRKRARLRPACIRANLPQPRADQLRATCLIRTTAAKLIAPDRMQPAARNRPHATGRSRRRPTPAQTSNPPHHPD